jgi:hypothetical protein
MPTSSTRGAAEPPGDDASPQEPASDAGRPTVVTEDAQTLRQARRDRLVRRVVIVGLAAFVVAGLLGTFGSRQADQRTRTETSSGEFDVELSHPARTRGGLPTRWKLTITRDDGTLPELEVRTTATYLDLFDFNSLTPEPDSVDQGDEIVWTFAASDQATTTIVLDVRTQPGSRWVHDATTEVVVDDEVVARFDYETAVLP